MIIQTFFKGLKYTITGFFCSGGPFLKLFLSFFLLKMTMVCLAYLDRVRFVLYQVILSGSEIQHLIYGFHFAINRPSLRLKSGIEVVCVNPAKKFPEIDIPDQRILKIKILWINGRYAKTH